MRGERRLEVGPRRGFASSFAGTAVEKQDMVNKLTLIRKSADEVSPLERLEEFITVLVNDALRNR